MMLHSAAQLKLSLLATLLVGGPLLCHCLDDHGASLLHGVQNVELIEFDNSKDELAHQNLQHHEEDLIIVDRVLLDDGNNETDEEIDSGLEFDEDFDDESFDVQAYYQQYLDSLAENETASDADFLDFVAGADDIVDYDVDENDFDFDSFDVTAFYQGYVESHNNDTIADEQGLSVSTIAEIRSRGSIEDIKDMVLEVIAHAEKEGMDPPELTDILVNLSTNFGFEPWVLPFYLEMFPDEADQVSDAYDQEVQEIKDRKTKVLIDLIMGTMMKDLKKGVPMEKILEKLGITQHELDQALEEYDDPELEKELEDAELEGAEYASQLTDHSDSSATRKLAEHGPTRELREKIEANEREHNEDSRQRRLRRADILKSTKNFLVRVDDHKNFVHHHARRLTNCDGLSNKECDAETLNDMTDTLVDMTDTVGSALDPILDFFKVFDVIENKLGKIKLVIAGLSLALLACAQLLDPYFGGIFTSLKQVVDVVKPKIDTMANKAKQFEDRFIERWNSTLSGVNDMMETFTTVTETAAGVGTLFVGVAQTPCAKSAFDAIAPGVISTTQDALGLFVDGAESIVNALSKLVSKIGGNKWKQVFSVLKFIANIGKKMFVVFNPLNPLAKIVTTKLYFPWVDLRGPGRLGPAKCSNSGGKKFKKVLSSCWETDSDDWKLLVMPPFHVQKKCGTQEMSTFVTGRCKIPGKNFETRVRHENRQVCINVNERRCVKINKQVCFTYSKKHCVGKGKWKKCKKVKVKKCDRVKVDKCDTIRVKKCDRVKVDIPYLVCPSGTQPYGAKCYGGCPGDFSRDVVVRNLCKTPRRAQDVKFADCSRFDQPSNLGPLGSCWKKCPKGFVNLGILCVKAGLFDFTMQQVFDEAEKLLEDLVGKWKKRIEDGLADVLEKALGFLTKFINKITGADFNPNFRVPGLSFDAEDLLPLGAIKNIDVPSLPSTNFDFAGNVMNKLTSKLPVNLASCGTDVDCLLNQLNLPSMDVIMDTVQNLISEADLQKAIDALMDIVPSIKCKAWDEGTIPMGDALKQLTGLTCEDCNKKIPVCARMGTDFLNDDIQAKIQQHLKPVLGGAITKVKEFANLWRQTRKLIQDDDVRRKLDGYFDAKKFMPVIPIAIPGVFGVDESKTNLKNGGWEGYFMADHGHEGGTQGGTYMSGFFVELIIRFRLDWGFNYVDFRDNYNFGHDIGMQFGWEFELKTSVTGEVNALLDRRRRWLEDMRSIDKSDIYNDGEGGCFTKEPQYLYHVNGDPTKLAYDVDLDPWNPFLINGDIWHDACKILEKARDLVWESPKKKCEPEDMKKYHDPQNKEERRRAIYCVKYWYDVKREVDDLLGDYKRKSSEAVTSIAVKKPNFLWNAIKGAVVHTIDPRNLALDSKYLLNFAVEEMFGENRGLRPRMRVKTVMSPVDYFEIGPVYELDFDNEGMKIHSFSFFSFTYNSAKILHRERQMRNGQKYYDEKTKKELTPGVGAIPIVSITSNFLCNVDTDPNHGQIQKAFWCPGVAGSSDGGR